MKNLTPPATLPFPAASRGWRQFLPCLLVSGLLLSALPATARAQTPGSLDLTFDPAAVTRGVIVLLVQPDGKILVGNSFQGANGVQGEIIRLNADGATDAGFSAGGSITSLNSLAVQPDGKIVFGSLGRVARRNADNTVDADFTSPTLFSIPRSLPVVEAVAVQPDGKILAGGFFTAVNGASRPALARLNADGAVDAEFDANLTSGTVRVVKVQPDGKILVGGDFTLRDEPTVSGLIRLNADGRRDVGFNVSPGGAFTPHSLAVQPNGKIIVGGSFAQVADLPRTNVVRLNGDGTLDSTFSAPTSGIVSAVVLQPDGKVVVGGSSTDVGAFPRPTVARLNADGSLDAEFSTVSLSGGAFPAVESLAVQPDGKILVGGNFSEVNGAPRVGIARLLGSSAPVSPSAPVVTNAAEAKASVGEPFTFQITATNTPTAFAAEGLPPGLLINPETGLITGTPTRAETVSVTLSATNAGGTGAATLILGITPGPDSVVSVRVDLPTISRAAGQAATVTFTRTGGNDSQKLDVAYSLTGNLIGGSDYAALSGTKKIKAGRSSATLQIRALSGGANGKVNLTILSGAGYGVEAPAKLKVKITD